MGTNTSHAEDWEIQSAKRSEQGILFTPATSMSGNEDVASHDTIYNPTHPIPRPSSPVPLFLPANERLKSLILQEFESALCYAASEYIGDEGFERMVLAVEEMQKVLRMVDPDLDSYGAEFTAAVTLFSTCTGSKALHDTWFDEAVENTKIFVEEMLACEDPNSSWGVWDDRLIEGTVREYCESVIDGRFRSTPYARVLEREEVESSTEEVYEVDEESDNNRKLKFVTLYQFKFVLSDVACEYVGDDAKFMEMVRRQLKSHAIKDREYENCEAGFKAAVVVFSTCQGLKDLYDTHFQKALDRTIMVVQLCCEAFNEAIYDEKFVEETLRDYIKSIFGMSISDLGRQRHAAEDIAHSAPAGGSDNAHEDVDGVSERMTSSSNVKVGWALTEREIEALFVELQPELDSNLEGVGDESEAEGDKVTEGKPQHPDRQVQQDPVHQSTEMGDAVVNEERRGSFREPTLTAEVHADNTTTVAETLMATWTNFWNTVNTILPRPPGH